MPSWVPWGGGVSSATLDFALDFVMAVLVRICIELTVLLPGLGIFFEDAVVVEVVLVVELLRLFGMACAVWVDSANFAEKMPSCTLPFWGFR